MAKKKSLSTTAPSAKTTEATETAKTPSKPERRSVNPMKVVRSVKGKARARLEAHHELSPHRSFKLTRKSEVPRYEPVQAWWRLVRQAAGIMWRGRFIIIMLCLALTVISWVVIGIAGAHDFSTFKQVTYTFVTQGFNGIDQAATLAQLGGTQPTDQSIVAQGLVGLFEILLWLSFIWLARHIMARKRTTLREALYLSGTSLVPTVLLMLLLLAQLLPGLLGVVLLGSAGSSSAAGPDAAPQVAVFIVLGSLLLMLSLYFIVGTFVALQVVALPGMYPWQALRDARILLAGRRFSVLRKILMMFVVLLLLWGLVMIPASLVDNKICGGEADSCWSTATILPTIAYLLTGLSLAFSSIYAYILYRSLLATRERK